MLRNRYIKWGGIIAFLILANIISYIYWNWGLITVKVTDAPLNKVIKSIEWQGWVTIYTNLPSDAKVTMWVDHVPLAEAMQALTANITMPWANRPPDSAPLPPSASGSTMVRQGGKGANGWWGGVVWNLGFFVAPSSAEVKAEIRAFQDGSVDNGMKIYNESTPMQYMTANNDDMPAADPRAQSWPGFKPPKPVPAPVSDPATQAPPPAAGDGQAAPADVSTPPPPPPPTVHTYLKALAKAADIWVMVPGSWTPEVSSPPPPNSSIISAVKNLVSRAHGSVTQAIILRGIWGYGGGSENMATVFAKGNEDNLDATADRIRNAINGLPEDARADALSQLDEEIKFFQNVRNAPEDQQKQMINDHIADKMRNSDRSGMTNPEKRSTRMQRIVSNRETVQGQK